MASPRSRPRSAPQVSARSSRPRRVGSTRWSTSTWWSSSGEFVSLIGPSGCGKSTLLRLIADLLQPTSGELVVNGKSAHQARLDQDYGMAFQQSGLFEWRSVERNIELPLELKGWDKAKRRARSREMLELVKLPDFASAHAVAAVGRHAAARRDRSRAGGAPRAAADGRAVRRARRDDPRAHAGRAAAHLRRDGHDGRVRHPLDPRGGLPRRSRGGHVAAARPDHRRRRRAASAATAPS